MQRNDKNVVLIGMPGCGKTTIGKLLSERLKMNFCDVDSYIEDKEGRSIPDIFKRDGEEYFRKLETKAVEDVSEYHMTVISSGGGVVKSSYNMEILRNSGIIIFINREVDDIISDIETDGRPLLKDGKEKLYKLHEERIDLYKKYCDYEVKNDTNIEVVLEKTVDIWKSANG